MSFWKAREIMNEFAVAIDVSNGSSHFRCFKSSSEPLGPSLKFRHDQDGLAFLEERVMKLQEKLAAEPVFVYEATGVYTRPVERYLLSHGYRICQISPLESAAQRRTDIHGKKTDKTDPAYIAQAYFSKKKKAPKMKEDPYWHALRLMNREYEETMNHLRTYKVSFQSTLAIVFPGYQTLGKDPYTPISLMALRRFPHPEMILHKKRETVIRRVMKDTRISENRVAKWVDKMIRLAQTTYPGCEKDDPEVELLIRKIDDILACDRRCKEILQQLIARAADSEYFECLCSIKGVGANLAARILAEVGDISRFRNVKALIAYAGLDPRKNQSGEKKGEHLGISKKGNRRLRTILYLAVTCNLRQGDPYDPISEYYKKKRQQSHPLAHTAAVIAASGKLLRTVYGMCNTKTMYLRHSPL